MTRGFHDRGGFRTARNRQPPVGQHIGQRPGRNDLSLVQQNQNVGKAFDLGDVVADVENRYGERFVKRFEVRKNLFLVAAIKGGERFVHQKKPRLGEKRAADRDALALAARQCRCRAIEQMPDPHQSNHIVKSDLFRSAGLQRAVAPIEQILPYGEMGEETRFLEDISDRAVVRFAKYPIPVLPHFASDHELARQTMRGPRHNEELSSCPIRRARRER